MQRNAEHCIIRSQWHWTLLYHQIKVMRETCFPIANEIDFLLQHPLSGKQRNPGTQCDGNEKYKALISKRRKHSHQLRWGTIDPAPVFFISMNLSFPMINNFMFHIFSHVLAVTNVSQTKIIYIYIQLKTGMVYTL